MMKKNITYFGIIIFSVIFIFIGNRICRFEKNADTSAEVFYAKIIEIENISEDTYNFGYDDFSFYRKDIQFSAKITSGEHKGKIVSANQSIDDSYTVKPKEVKKGNNILITYTEYTPTGEPGWIFTDYNRINATIFLCICFLLLLLIIGRKKGISTIISLAFTCAVIFMVYIPSILKGYNIYLSTIIISIYIIIMSLLIIDGANKKTLCAILGNIGGVAISGILVIIMTNILNLTGLINEEYIFLSTVNADNPLNLKAVIWGAVVIGALGAIMDVAMTIASSMNELAEYMDKKSFPKMLKSGMNIGRDAIGTMTNTLILAYIGGSIALVLLLIANTGSFDSLFNMEMIIVEIMQAVIGSIGILFAVPITAVCAAYVFNRD